MKSRQAPNLWAEEYRRETHLHRFVNQLEWHENPREQFEKNDFHALAITNAIISCLKTKEILMRQNVIRLAHNGEMADRDAYCLGRHEWLRAALIAEQKNLKWMEAEMPSAQVEARNKP